MIENMSSADWAEWIKCAKDFAYFCETYVKVSSPEHGLVPFKLYPHQLRYVEAITNEKKNHRFVIGKKFRQGGFTTLNAIYFMWRCIFKKNETMLIMSKTDREAINTGYIVSTALENLPEFLKPQMDKNDHHQKTFAHTGCGLLFYTPEAARGRSLHFIYVDEPAFISGMEKHWKAMYPCVATGGSVYMMSTPNGTNNWFYETYLKAKAGESEFYVYDCEYNEHPDYSRPEWKIETMKNLGPRHFRQEVLQEFLDKETLEDKAKKVQEFFDEATAGEQARPVENRKFDPRSSEELKLNGWNDNCLDSVFRKGENMLVDDDPDTRPEAIQFKNLSREQTKNLFQKHLKDYDPRQVTHPDFCTDPLFENGADLFEVMDEMFGYEEWKERRQEIDHWRENIETAIDNHTTYLDLRLSGLIGKKEMPADSERRIRPDVEIFHKIKQQGKFPFEMQLSFGKGRLCVNGCPTVIREEDVRHTYNGLAYLESHESAVDMLVACLTRKLNVLFFKEPAEAK